MGIPDIAFATLAEYANLPAGVAARIMGHRPSALAERHYIRRSLKELAKWHAEYETWVLGKGGIAFNPSAAGGRLQVVTEESR